MEKWPYKKQKQNNPGPRIPNLACTPAYLVAVEAPSGSHSGTILPGQEVRLGGFEGLGCRVREATVGSEYKQNVHPASRV